MTPDQLTIIAEQADRFKSDPAVQRAVIAMRERAIDALIATEPTDVEGIRTRQAEIKAIDGFCQELANAILRAPRKPMAVA